MEGMLGILFLSASIDQLKRLGDMPEALEQIGIFIPKACLMYALGYTKELSEEGFPTVEQADAFMKLAYEQPGRLQLPARPQIDDGQSITFKTNVLGCEVSLRAQANAFSICVGELFWVQLRRSLRPASMSASFHTGSQLGSSCVLRSTSRRVWLFQRRRREPKPIW